MRDRRRWLVLAAALAVIVAVIISIERSAAPTPEGSPAAAESPEAPASTAIPDSSTPQAQAQATEPSGTPAPTVQAAASPTAALTVAPEVGALAPDFAGVTRWLNSAPLSIDDLRGKVVLVDFWTYTCINCLRTLPFVRDWHVKYSPEGLVVVGVHTPEFQFEHAEPNVREAMARERVLWPVAMDNDYSTWRAYRNRYWPHKFLIDSNGAIRYHHIGEGAYEETERQIRALLEEAGSEPVEDSGGRRGRLEHARRGRHAGDLRGARMGRGRLSSQRPFAGWRGSASFRRYGTACGGQAVFAGGLGLGVEAVRHVGSSDAAAGHAAFRFIAPEVQLLASVGSADSAEVQVEVNGRPVSAENRGADLRVDEQGRTYLVVDGFRMYRLLEGLELDDRELRLSVATPGLAIHVFTFGGQPSALELQR